MVIRVNSFYPVIKKISPCRRFDWLMLKIIRDDHCLELLFYTIILINDILNY